MNSTEDSKKNDTDIVIIRKMQAKSTLRSYSSASKSG